MRQILIILTGICLFMKLYNLGMRSPAYGNTIIPRTYAFMKVYMSKNCGLNNIQLIILILSVSYSSLNQEDITKIIPIIPLLLITEQAEFKEKILRHLKKQATIYREYKDGVRRAAGYGRVSTKKQEREGQSLEEQRRIILELAKKYKASTLHLFLDGGKSGTTMKGRKIAIIQRMAKEDLIDDLYLAYVDRLGRNLLECLGFVLILFRHNVRIITPDTVYDHHNLGSFIGLIVKLYSADDVNKERTRKSIESKRSNFLKKNWNKRFTPLGYAETSDGWIQVIEAYQPLIRGIYDLYLDGFGYADISRQINQDFETILDKRVSSDRVKSTLTDPTYIGEPEHLGAVVHDPSLRIIKAQKYNTVKKRIYPEEENKTENKLDPIGLLWTLYPDIFEFLDNIGIHHNAEYCHGELVKNGRRRINDVWRQGFICNSCGKQFWVPNRGQYSEIMENSTYRAQSHPLNLIAMSDIKPASREKREKPVEKKNSINSSLEDYF